jgi:large subunit ribosomal protein L24
MGLRIKKGDQVAVLTGKDKGKQGQVLKVLTDTSRVIVSGVNVAKKHVKPGQGSMGGIESVERSIHSSNVSLIDPASGKPTKFGVKILEDGRKVRFAKKSGEVLDAAG